MIWLLRQSAALIAAYSIALQALLSGFVLAAHVTFDPFVICAVGSSGSGNPLPQHGSDHDACLTACSSPSPALIPSNVMFSLVFFANRPRRLSAWIEAIVLQPRHQPQASRAPPTPA
jgi:hypothetical protein